MSTQETITPSSTHTCNTIDFSHIRITQIELKLFLHIEIYMGVYKHSGVRLILQVAYASSFFIYLFWRKSAHLPLKISYLQRLIC